MATYQKAPQLLIYPGNCVRERSPLTDCHICEDVCPSHTLQFGDHGWSAPDCSRCGLCVALCPTQVFALDQFHLMQWKEVGPLSLCCSENTAAPESALRLNCLQQLSPLTILYLIYRHGRVTVSINRSQCANCSQKWYPDSLLLQMKAYALPEERFNVQYVESTVAETNGRRSFFTGLRERTEHISRNELIRIGTQAARVLSVDTAEETTHEIMPLRLALYALLVKNMLPVSANTAPSDAPSSDIGLDASTDFGDTLPFRNLECTSCSFCGACARMCPTGALTMEETDTSASLAFHPELCIDCRICTDCCMEKGLSWGEFLTRSAFLETPQQLAKGSVKICDHCGHEFCQWPEAEESLCRFCRR